MLLNLPLLVCILRKFYTLKNEEGKKIEESTTQSNISKVNRLMAELSGGNTSNRLLCLCVAAGHSGPWPVIGDSVTSRYRSSAGTGRHAWTENGVAETCVNHRGKGGLSPAWPPCSSIHVYFY